MNTKKQYFSAFRRANSLQKALLDLFVSQTPVLIEALYKKETDPEIRVGLTIKILHNTPEGSRFSLETLRPVVTDIESMIKDHDYLRSTGEPRLRLRCLRNELDLIQRYIDLDETLSLNCGPDELTFQDSMGSQSEVQRNEEPETEQENETCLLM